MPIYEYRCEKCGHRFERWQKMSDPDPDQCPECKAADVERVISAVGFRLKGGGWYETDFKQNNRHNIAGDGEGSGKKDKAEGGKKEKTTDASSSKGSGEKKKVAGGKTGDTAA